MTIRRATMRSRNRQRPGCPDRTKGNIVALLLQGPHLPFGVALLPPALCIIRASGAQFGQQSIDGVVGDGVESIKPAEAGLMRHSQNAGLRCRATFCERPWQSRSMHCQPNTGSPTIGWSPVKRRASCFCAVPWRPSAPAPQAAWRRFPVQESG